MSVHAGDGTNDVFAPKCVDAGTVTGGSGSDVVTEVVDAASTDDDFRKTVSVAKTVRRITYTVYENAAPVTGAKAVASTSVITGSGITRTVAPVDAGAMASVAPNVTRSPGKNCSPHCQTLKQAALP